MHIKDICSPSSKGGIGIGVNSAGRMQSNAGVFPSSSSAVTKESLPSLAGNSSNDVGSDSLYPDSVSRTKYDLRVIQKKHPENSDEVVTLQQEKGQIRTVNKELQKKKIGQSITSPIKIFGVDINTAGNMQSDAGASAFSDLTNQNQPDAGKCSNVGGVSFYPYSEAGSDFDSYVVETVNRPEETSKKVEALQQENDLNVSKSIISPMEVHNLQKLPPRRPPTDEVPSKARFRKELGQSSNQSVSKIRQYWTASENDAFTKALLENPGITVAQLHSLPELRDKPRESVKTKLREHKTVPLSEAKLGGKSWTSQQDNKLKAAYNDHGMDWPKLMEAGDGRTKKAVYDRIKKFLKEKTVVEHEGLKKTVGEHEGPKKTVGVVEHEGLKKTVSVGEHEGLKKTVSEHEGLKKTVGVGEHEGLKKTVSVGEHEGLKKTVGEHEGLKKTVGVGEHEGQKKGFETEGLQTPTAWAEVMKCYIDSAFERLEKKVVEGNRKVVADAAAEVRHALSEEVKSPEFINLLAKAIRGGRDEEKEK